MYRTSELVPLLAERGVHLYREHVYRLVTKTAHYPRTLPVLRPGWACQPGAQVRPPASLACLRDRRTTGFHRSAMRADCRPFLARSQDLGAQTEAHAALTWSRRAYARSPAAVVVDLGPGGWLPNVERLLHGDLVVAWMPTPQGAAGGVRGAGVPRPRWPSAPWGMPATGLRRGRLHGQIRAIGAILEARAPGSV
jgi:hypothetical protein